jgi:hypothetical protein
LSQNRSHFDLFNHRVFEGEDVLTVIEPLRVFGMRETIAGRPFILILYSKRALWKVTCNHYGIEHFHEVLNLHNENAILDIPSVNVSLIVSVPIQYIHTIELLSHFLGPCTCIAIIKWTIPFLRVSPWILDSHESMHLSRFPLLSSLSSDLTHIQYRIIESRLESFRQSKSVEIVLSIFVHLREHLKIEFAAQHTMVVAEDSQAVEETCLIRSLEWVNKKCLGVRRWP